MPEIGLAELPGGVEASPGGVRPLDGAGLALRFAVSAEGDLELEALRIARRSLLREELTRGREPGEPSLTDAVFSPQEILWVIRPDQRPWCLEKVEELRRRANSVLSEGGRSRPGQGRARQA